jgi:hypothetical protein
MEELREARRELQTAARTFAAIALKPSKRPTPLLGSFSERWTAAGTVARELPLHFSSL